ncbi:MAG TPA: ABC transporter permease subunit [Streptosporangiaceae bacterium]|jgi:ABC-type transport system involved in multi-copper enzyme maturation permease subunit
MTTATVIPESAATERAGFGCLLYAEWTKFVTVRGWVIAMIVSALLTVAFGIWIGAGTHGQPCGMILPNGQAASGACPAPPLGPGGELVTDSFYFVRQTLSGNGTVTARVTSLAGSATPGIAGGTSALQPWAKAGIIVKASLRQGSAYAAMMVTGSHGVRMQDDYTQDIAGLPGGVSASAPRWLRLVRSGDTLTGYDSADGTHWTQVGTARLPGLATDMQAGIFVTSPDSVTDENAGATLASADFDHVTVAGSRPGSQWAGQDVGASAAYSPLPGGYRQAGGTFTVRGSGDIAPAVKNAGVSGSTADAGITGVFAGLIVVLVVGTMFITSEYRRGLIRTTLAATPRRSQVLAAKAIVTGAVAFTAGLAGSAAAVLVGEDMLRGSGRFIFPVDGLTEARVIVGSAALLAVAAVLALALGVIWRHGAGPVTATIALIVVPFFFTGPMAILRGTAADWLLRVTPAAAFAVQQVLPAYPQVSNTYIPQYGYYPLSPWAGFAVLCAWAVAALGLAAFLLRRRDA